MRAARYNHRLNNKDVLMGQMCFRRVALGLTQAVMLLVFGANGFAQYSNGIYAEFNTSLGSYTCRLEHVLAPMACANFIGLATGEVVQHGSR